MTQPDPRSDSDVEARDALDDHMLAELRDVASRAADTATDLYVAQEHESRNSRFEKALERACGVV